MPSDGDQDEQVTGGGLLQRRALLVAGAVSAGGLVTGARTEAPASMREPGAPLSGCGNRARLSETVQRIVPELPFPATG